MEKNRILLADDDDNFRETAASFLRQAGYDCSCAPDAATAAQLLGASEFDLLISDIEMPGNHNLELIHHLACIARGLPCILLTGHPTVQTAIQSVQLPVVAYLVKPPKPDELLEVVRQSIERFHTYQAVAANRQRLEEWSRDLGRIEELLRQSHGETATASVDDYLALTFQNLLASLLDLRKTMEALGQQEGKSGALAKFPLVEALKETVEVLAKSRQSFKSRELAELRRKLEALIQAK